MSEWAVLVGLWLIYFLENLERYLLGVSLVPYIDYRSVEYSFLAGPAFSIAYAVLGLVISLYVQGDVCCYTISIPRLRILAGAAVVFSLAFTTTAFASSFWQICAIRVVMGGAQSIVTPFASSIITRSFSARVRGLAFGIFSCATYVAFSCALSLGTWVYTQYGWRAGYLVFGT